MEPFFKAQEVINKDLLKKSIPLCFLSLINLFIWGNSSEHFLKYIPIIMVFSYMVVEDHINREVDLRLVGFGFLLLILTVPSIGMFFGNLLIGTMIFLAFFFIACKPRKSSILEDPEQQTELGFLPSIGLSILIFNIIDKYDFFTKLFPKWEENSLLGFIALSIPVFVFSIVKYCQLKRKEKNEDVVIEEGFGMGDVFICSLGFGFWGGTDFLTIIFLALLIQLAAYKYKTIKTKDELNGI